MEFNYSVSYHEKCAEIGASNMQNIVFLDIAIIILFIVLAYLSKRLGEALKTPPLYKLFYAGVILIIVAVLINTISVNNLIPFVSEFFDTVSMAVRFGSCFLAIVVSMLYWRWLFSEIFKS